MASPRNNLKNLMRRLNVLSDIPEERAGVDGRPASRIVQHEKSDVKQGSATTTTTISELTPGTNQFRPQAGDLLFVPQDVDTPTNFGPNNEYKAVPSILEYSTSRGKSRVSIREATPDEARESAGSDMPIISEIPEFAESHEAGLRANAVPLYSPPPNFKPIRVNLSPANAVKRTSSASDQSIRTSTTSMRASTASVSDQTIRDSIAEEDENAIFETGSDTATLNAPGPPPQRVIPGNKAETDYTEKPASTTVSLPSRRPSTNGSTKSHMRNPSHDLRRSNTVTTSHSSPGSFDTVQSRFSWHVTKTERTKNWFTRWFIEWWALEIFSWLFSAICMMIIIIVLWKVDGKSIPNWKLGVSTNAFISIFSGFAKSALLLPTAEALGQLKWSWFKKERKMMDFEVLDGASRGPWGSMVLLSKTKGITLASVGAAIILLSLPLDLFFQQIISYPTVALIDPAANATIARSVLYDPNEELQYQGDTPVTPWDGAMNSLVYPYWLAAGLPWGVSFDCPTGNCTFDPFHTLAVDFQCKEMPHYLEFGCKNTSAEWLSTVAYGGPRRNPNVTSCGYYLDVPGDLPQLMSGYEVQADGSIGEVLATRFVSLSDIFTHEAFLNGSVNFDVRNPIVDFILTSTPGGFDGATKNNSPVVTECEIHWVVKKLQSKIVSGDLFEEALETLQFSSEFDNPWNPENPEELRANYTMTLPDPHSVSGTSTYGLSNITALKVWEIWAQIAPSTYTRPSKTNPITDDPVLKLYWFYNPVHLLKVYGPGLPWDAPANVTDHMSQAVTVMNQIIRRNAASQTNHHDVVLGTAIKDIVLVHIRWQWITLPAALLLFALLFLLATIWRSSRDKEQIGIWKTSALAILFNGLGEDVQNYVGQGNKKQGYTRSKANDLKVQLEGD